MRIARLRFFLALVALVGAAGCGGGSGAPTAPASPATPSTPAAQQLVSADLPVANLSAPGLYQDGLGTYPPGNVYLTPNNTGLFLQPQCPGSSRTPARETNLVLPQTARDVVAARVAKCGGYGVPGEQIYLHLPNPSTQRVGGVIGAGGLRQMSTSAGVCSCSLTSTRTAMEPSRRRLTTITIFGGRMAST